MQVNNDIKKRIIMNDEYEKFWKERNEEKPTIIVTAKEWDNVSSVMRHKDKKIEELSRELRYIQYSNQISKFRYAFFLTLTFIFIGSLFLVSCYCQFTLASRKLELVDRMGDRGVGVIERGLGVLDKYCNGALIE